MARASIFVDDAQIRLPSGSLLRGEPEAPCGVHTKRLSMAKPMEPGSAVPPEVVVLAQAFEFEALLNVLERLHPEVG